MALPKYIFSKGKVSVDEGEYSPVVKRPDPFSSGVLIFNPLMKGKLKTNTHDEEMSLHEPTSIDAR